MTTVGVPVSTQAVLNARPAGRVGFEEQLVIVPPVLAGVWLAIAVPLVKVKGEPAKEMPGITSLTVIEIVTGPVPWVLVAVIV